MDIDEVKRLAHQFLSENMQTFRKVLSPNDDDDDGHKHLSRLVIEKLMILLVRLNLARNKLGGKSMRDFKQILIYLDNYLLKQVKIS